MAKKCIDCLYVHLCEGKGTCLLTHADLPKPDYAEMAKTDKRMKQLAYPGKCHGCHEAMERGDWYTSDDGWMYHPECAPPLEPEPKASANCASCSKPIEDTTYINTDNGKKFHVGCGPRKEANDIYAASHKEVEDLRARNKQLEGDLVSYQKWLDNVRADRDKLIGKREDLKRENERLEVQLRAQREHAEGFGNANNILRKEVEELRGGKMGKKPEIAPEFVEEQLPERYCGKCGQRLVVHGLVIARYDYTNGKPQYRATLKCPKARWYNSGHDRLVIWKWQVNDYWQDCYDRKVE